MCYNLTILLKDNNKEMKIKNVENHHIENGFLYITFWHEDHWQNYMIATNLINLVHSY